MRSRPKKLAFKLNSSRGAHLNLVGNLARKRLPLALGRLKVEQLLCARVCHEKGAGGVPVHVRNVAGSSRGRATKGQGEQDGFVVSNSRHLGVSKQQAQWQPHLDEPLQTPTRFHVSVL